MYFIWHTAIPRGPSFLLSFTHGQWLEYFIGHISYRLLYLECCCHIKNVEILGGTPTWDLDVPVHPIVANHAGWPSVPYTRRLSRVCDNRVTGNPPNRVGGTPREGLAGLVRARARHGPSSRQKNRFLGYRLSKSDPF